MNFNSENTTLKNSAEYKMLKERSERIQQMKETVKFLQEDYDKLYAEIKISNPIPAALIHEYLKKGGNL